MNKRPIDKTKQSNIKCEHCAYWNNEQEWHCRCSKDASRKANYWNRCKDFKWRTDKEYKDDN